MLCKTENFTWTDNRDRATAEASSLGIRPGEVHPIIVITDYAMGVGRFAYPGRRTFEHISTNSVQGETKSWFYVDILTHTITIEVYND
jgi:hypothetical protein